MLTGDALAAARKKAGHLPSITVDAYTAFDIDGIAKGLFSPLTGFMGEAETRAVLDTMHLRPGIPWTIPILLDVSREQAARLEVGAEVALQDDTGDVVAILHLAEKFSLDRAALCEKVYQTTDESHPGVTIPCRRRRLPGGRTRRPQGPRNRVPGVQPHARRNPRRVRILLETHRRFQTQPDPPRARIPTKCSKSATASDPPLMGTTKSDDIPGDVRMKYYRAHRPVLPQDYVMSLMPVNMRYAGPKEATARHHPKTTDAPTSSLAATTGAISMAPMTRSIFDRSTRGIGITPLFFDTPSLETDQSMASPKTCPGTNEDHVFLSGTKVREMLKRGEMPPPGSLSEAARILIAWAENGE